MFNNIKIGPRLIGGFLLVSMITAGIGIIGVMSISTLNRAIDTMYDKHLMGISHAKEVNLDLMLIARAVRQMLLSKDFTARREQITAIEKYDKELRAEMEAARKSIVTAEAQKIFNEAAKNYEEYYRHVVEYRRIVEGAALLKLDPRIIAELDKLYVSANKTVDAFEMLTRNEEQSGKKMYDEYDVYSDRAEVLMIALVIIGTLLGSGIGFFASRSISRPLLKVVEQADRISLGDFNLEKLDIRSKDETGMLAESFQKMSDALKSKAALLEQVANGDLTVEVPLASEKDGLGKSLASMLAALNDALGQVNAAVEQVSAGSTQVSSASQSLSQGASEQASSLEEITSAITEISNQSAQNAENAITANTIAKQTMEKASSGNAQMRELVEAMDRINVSAEDIKKIVKVIDDIAFQINLLALNANVEAARAGKYGKGFAVVAEEVRNLAGRSAKSVADTTRMVETSINSVASGSKLVGNTAEQLTEIVNSASKMADLVEEIAVASKEQAQGINQINTGLGQIDQVTQANTSNAEESASAAEELASQAQQLKAMVARFKLSGKTEPTSATDTAGMVQQLVAAEIAKRDRSAGAPDKGNGKTPGNSPVSPKNIIKLEDANFGHF